jgi:hypothetical protein
MRDAKSEIGVGVIVFYQHCLIEAWSTCAGVDGFVCKWMSMTRWCCVDVPRCWELCWSVHDSWRVGVLMCCGIGVLRYWCADNCVDVVLVSCACVDNIYGVEVLMRRRADLPMC